MSEAMNGGRLAYGYFVLVLKSKEIALERTFNFTFVRLLKG